MNNRKIRHQSKLKDMVKILFDMYAYKSFSQEGEDIILRKIFGTRKNGFYVDVGAHHPIRFSNTYHFYRRGWSGINIDAMPGCMRLFNLFRKRDINLEFAISTKQEKLIYYVFNDPALNGFKGNLSENRESNKYKIIDKIAMDTHRLGEILDKFMTFNRNIDFLSIDVEGFELNVLKSNDWVKYRPKIILVEELNNDLLILPQLEIYNYLTTLRYQCIAKTFNTLFFVDKEN